MNLKTKRISTSVKFPLLKTPQKFLITLPDDKGFAQDQVDKIFQGLYLIRQKKLKPWEKEYNKNIYQTFGKSNHQLLENIRKKTQSYNSLSEEDLSKINYYKNYQLNTISNTQEISKQIRSNSYIRKQFKLPNASIKTYIIETKKICKKKILSDVLKNERDIMQKKLNEYQNSLKKEVVNLDKDIYNFEQYKTKELLKRNKRFNYMKQIELKRKNLEETIKDLNKEKNLLTIETQRTLKFINDEKIYSNFVHKLLGGEAELSNYNFDDINFFKIGEDKIHELTNILENEMLKNKGQDNILTNSSEEELLGNIQKIDLIFKFMEEKIMKTSEKNEKLRNEMESKIEEWENEKKEMEKKIQEREKEYKDILKEYEDLKEKIQLIPFFESEHDDFIRKLHIELFECIKDVIIKNKSEINEFNIKDKIIKPNLEYIKDKEIKLVDLVFEMEKYSKKDHNLFYSSVTKIKNENKIFKFHQERYNREIENSLKNGKILEKMNKIMFTGKYKFNMKIPLNLIKKKKSTSKTKKDANNDFKLLYY